MVPSMAIEPPPILQHYLQVVWGELDAGGAAQFLHPSYRRHIAPHLEPLDRDGQLRRLAAFMRAFAEITLTLHDVITQGDRIAFRATFQGVHAGEFGGIPPTGQAVAVSLVDIMRIQDGLIIEHWGGPDMHDLMWQLTEAGGM